MVTIPSTLNAGALAFLVQLLGLITLLVTLYFTQKYEHDIPKTKKSRRILFPIVIVFLLSSSVVGFYRFQHIPNTQWQAIEQAYGIEVTEKDGSLNDGESVEIAYIKDGDTFDGVVGVTGDTATVYTDDEPLPVVAE